MQRPKVRELCDEPLDVLIIGGGIVGAGIARDAAMRGLRVGLVEQNDFASGTSSRTSRLLHGGLRYLAKGHVRLVRQSSREKRIIHHIAPHLAAPLGFIFPTYRRSRWPKWKLGVGVRIYDLLCGRRNLGHSHTISRSRTVELLSGVEQAGLTGGVRYFDGLTSDARLVLDTLRSAHRHGALLCNYVRMVKAERSTSAWLCHLHDRLCDEELKARAAVVVNATGPWADAFPQSSIKLRPTKGTHLVIHRSRLPLPDGVVMPEGDRILFAIPWGERVILGTTDTDVKGPIDHVQATSSDVDYILTVVNGAFPETELTDDDVLSTWSGVRPLVADSRGNPSDISRSHDIRMSQPGWLDVAGGKLTTYRLMAEQAVDRIARHVGRRVEPCSTAREPLLEAGETEGVSGIVPPPLTRAAVEHYCREEWAVGLDDVMVRRGGWHHYVPDRESAARQVAERMAGALGWDAAHLADELERYRGEWPRSATP